MKISLNWVKEYVEIPQDWQVEKLAHDLTMSTVEVENVFNLGKKFENLIVGVIKQILPHPNADKLKIAKTDIGNNQIKEIVCGGTNLYEGMKVVVACPGAFVRWHGEGQPVKIKITNLRGVESYGMICASSEIELADLFPEKSDGEVVDLSAFNHKAGTPLATALELNDFIFEIDNKSLTNRPDLWGHYGIAREFSAIYNLSLKPFKQFKNLNVPKLNISIEDGNLCRRYIGLEVENVSVKPSPFYLQTRLWSVGLRPINAIVDITNYVMLATGQPTHAFDFEKIKGNINVRLAKNKEKLLALNGKELELSMQDLVIADEKGAVGLAGVIGGEKDSVLPNTNKIILEIANFNPLNIRHTVLRHDCRTDSSARNEKGLDAQRCDDALALSFELLQSIFPNMKTNAFCDNYLVKQNKLEIIICLNWLKKRLGKDLSNQYIKEKLESLGFEIKIDKNNMFVIVPSWRATGDISIADDVLEEIARIYGFENFAPSPITTTFEKAINQVEINLDRKIREYLAFKCGMNEIFSYPWANENFINAILPDISQLLKLSSPPSPSERFIANSHLPNLCRTVSANLRYYNTFQIFQSAQIFSSNDFSSQYDNEENLPKYERSVAGAFVDSAENAPTLFRKVKGVITSLPKNIHTHSISFIQTKKPYWANDVAWQNIVHCNKIIGSIGLLSQKSMLSCGIKNSAVALFELNIDQLKAFLSRSNKFEKLLEYPTNHRDISLMFDVGVKWNQILEVISNVKNNLLQEITFVDEYKGRQVLEGKKSITINLVIGSNEKTLTTKEIDDCVNSVLVSLKEKFNAQVR